MKNIMITGASGLLGRAIFEKLFTDSFNILGTSFSRYNEELLSLDLTDFDLVRKCVEKFQPDIIIHCAAERSPDICEKQPEKTKKINVNATQNLAQLGLEYSAKLIFISTDYVFDGSKPPYQINDQPNPINAYGISKWQAEKSVLLTNPKSIVLRVPVLYGPIEFLEESAVTTIFNAVLKQNTSKQDHWAIRYPTYTPDIAEAIYQLISLPNLNHLLGIYHFSGHQPYTKYEMAKIMAKIFDYSDQNLIADDKMPIGAIRPQNCHLDDKELRKIIPLQLTDFTTAITKVLFPFHQSNKQ